MKKIKNTFCYFISLILLTGCWDAVNIEDRAFVVGNAIDIVEDSDEKQPEFIITNQVIVPAGMVPEAHGSGKGEQPFLNYTSHGKSIYSMTEEVTTVSSKVPYFEHLAILAVSDKVAKIPGLFTKILDTYIRDVNIRRGMKVVISKGEAKKLLEFQSPNYELPTKNIDELLEKSSREVGHLTPKVAGDIEEYNLRKNSYILPYLHLKEYLEYDAGAVFHGPKDKMVGTLNAEDMQGLGMIGGEQTTKIIDLSYRGESFGLKIIRSKNKIKVEVDPSNMDQIQVNVSVELEGIIKESFAKIDFTNSSAIDSVQQKVSDHVEKMIKNVIQKAQEEFEADIFNIWRILETKHYNTWKKIKDNWEEGENHFKNVEFEVNVITEIYSTGTTEESK